MVQKSEEKSYLQMREEDHLRKRREYPDPTPVAPPVGYVKQPSIADIVRQQIQAHRAMMAQEGPESFEEHEDFDIGDDYDPTSPYEQDFEVAPVSELRRRAEEDIAARNAPAAVSEPPKVPPAEPAAPPQPVSAPVKPAP